MNSNSGAWFESKDILKACSIVLKEIEETRQIVLQEELKSLIGKRYGFLFLNKIKTIEEAKQYLNSLSIFDRLPYSSMDFIFKNEIEVVKRLNNIAKKSDRVFVTVKDFEQIQSAL